MKVYGFTGIRFDTTRLDPGALAAPPFDQIDDRLRDRLHQVEHHFAHLTRPAAASGGEPPERARRLYRSWRQAGLLMQERSPALYPYEIRLEDGGRRLGLCGLVGLEHPSSGIVRPHEGTVVDTVADRLKLLRALRADLEPILLLSDDDGRLDELLQEDVTQSAPLVRHRDPHGNLHLLHRASDADRIRRYQELLEPCSALIADGHHRWEVARAYAAETRAEKGAAACKLAVITSVKAPALRIDPIHRAVHRQLDFSNLGETVKTPGGWTGSGGSLAVAVAEAAQPALAVATTESPPEILHLEPTWASAGLPAPVSRLAVCALHSMILPGLGLSDSAASDGTLLYRSDPDSLLEAVRRGEIGTAFWLPPIDPQALFAAVAAGVVLPPKATRFLPKLISGLVWAEHDDEIA